MNKLYIMFGAFFMISTIIISGCVSPYEVSTPHTETSPADDTATPTVSYTIDPVQLLSAPTWTWHSRIRMKDVAISDNGDYIGGLSTQKVVIKTPTKNLLTNLVWKNANFISISDSGKYIAIADEDFVKLYDNDGNELFSYNTGGIVNHIGVLDSGVLFQGGEKTPQLSAVDSSGNEIWVWNPGISTAKTLDFDYSANGENFFIGTQDERVYYLSNIGKYLWFKDVSGEVEDIEMSDDGERLYVLTDDNTVHSFDKYGNKNWEKELDVNTFEIDISKGGDYILTKPVNAANSPSFEYKVYLLDKHGNVKWMKQMNSEVGVVGISEDSKYVIISEGRDLRMYNLMGDELASYHLDSQYGNFFVSLDMTPDAEKLVLGTTNSILVFG